MGRNESSLGRNRDLGGEWRNEGMNAKAIKKVLSVAESYVTITWHRFFGAVSSCFGLHFWYQGTLN